MKKISLLFAFVLLLASCSENNNVTPDPDSDEGVHTSLGLSVAPMQGDKGDVMLSRSVPDVNESLINRLWVLQFESETGVLLKKSYLPVSDPTKVDIVLRENEEGKTSHIYFVANAGKSILANFYGSETDFKAAVGPFTSELGLVTSNGDQTVKCIPMCGDVPNKTVTKLGIEGGINVLLTRMLVRIDVKCNIAAAAAEKFSLQTIRLGNVPNAVKYFDTPAPVGGTMDYALEGCVSSNTYTFYVPENLRGDDAANEGGPDKLKLGVPGATYFELKGIGLGLLCDEEIKFRVYPGTNTSNNYDLKRNTKYVVSANLDNLSFSDRRLSRVLLPIPRSNCYIVKPGGFIKIPIERANDSKLGKQITDINNSNCTASVFWETPKSGTTDGENISVINENCDRGFFTVTAASVGNAVVAIRKNKADGTVDPDGKILWSWHIWVSDVDFKSGNTLPANGYTWMDRNLGALDVPAVGKTYATTAGMMYQWGRKDPFLPAVVDDASITATSGTMPITAASIARITASYPATGLTAVGKGDSYLKYNTAVLATSGTFTYLNQFARSVESPMLFINGWSGSLAIEAAGYTTDGGMSSWGGEANQSKSVYDPCPAGWRIPSGRRTIATWASPWNGATCTTSGGANGKFSMLSSTFGTYAQAGCRGSSDGAFGVVGGYGCYWSGSVIGTTGYYLSFGGTTVSPSGSSGRANGYSARCVQEP